MKFIVDAMNAMGCPVNLEKFFMCMSCNGDINGGFQLDEKGMPSIALCQNHLRDQESMNRTMAHELLHAFDHCRAKVNWKNCEHHACSEVGDTNKNYVSFRCALLPIGSGSSTEWRLQLEV